MTNTASSKSATSVNTNRKRLRAIGHQLNPVVTISGNGLTEGVLNELERALNDHELIKIKLVADREDRKVLTQEVLNATGAELVQAIGGVALLLRLAEKRNKNLSNLLRTDIL